MSKQLHEYSFLAGLHKFDAASRIADFYIMNTSKNRNRWGVTEKALFEASPSLKGKKLGMGTGYRIDKHYPAGEIMDVGVFTAYENKGNYLTGGAKIEDVKTVSLLEKGELGPISVIIHAYDVACSKCGAELEASPEAVEKHACFKEGAYELINSFVFARVDFVDVPAYPQAGLLELASNTVAKAIPIELLAGFYESSCSQKLQENKKVSEKIENEKIAALEQRATKAESDFKKAQDDANANKAKVDDLSAKLKDIEEEKHVGLVEQAYKARAAAGVAGKETEEKIMLAKLDDSTLKLFIADAQKVAKVVSAKSRPVPEIEFTAEAQEGLGAAVEAERERMGFPARKVASKTGGEE